MKNRIYNSMRLRAICLVIIISTFVVACCGAITNNVAQNFPYSELETNVDTQPQIHDISHRKRRLLQDEIEDSNVDDDTNVEGRQLTEEELILEIREFLDDDDSPDSIRRRKKRRGNPDQRNQLSEDDDDDDDPFQQQPSVQLDDNNKHLGIDNGDTRQQKNSININHIPDDLKQQGIKPSINTTTGIGIQTSLPSFENTAIPPKKTFAEWQIEQHQKNPFPTAELTSSSFLLPGAPPPGSGYVAACIIARDAHDDLVEWINHHLKFGIFPIYIYDHASTPPLASIIRHHRNKGDVFYSYFTDFDHPSNKPQLYVYDRCLQEHGHKHTWMMFIDVDEFLMFKEGPPIQSISALLQRYENHSALAVHWILFGSSGHEVRPLQGALKSYVRCLPLEHSQHLFVKTIANTKCTLRVADSPHSFVHNCSADAVRTDFSPIFGQTAADYPVHTTLAIHHYATKSAEEFEIKMLRGSGMKRQRKWEYFFFVDSWSTEFNFDGLSAWDSDTMTMPRFIDGTILEEQLAVYINEEHDDFWGKASHNKRDPAKVPKVRRKKGGGDDNSDGVEEEEDADSWGADDDDIRDDDDGGGF